MNTRLVDCHLFDFPVPIYSALIAVASQENHDAPEDDLIVRAAEYIKVLECLVDLTNTIHNATIDYIRGCNANVPTNFVFNEDRWMSRQDDPGIASQAIQILFNDYKVPKPYEDAER